MDFDGAAQITITDELLGPSEGREVTVSFLLDPLCEAMLEREGGVLIARAGRPLARLMTAGPLKVRTTKGDANSNLGWVSQSFSARVPANQILLEGTLERPSIVTINLLSLAQPPHRPLLRAAMILNTRRKISRLIRDQSTRSSGRSWSSSQLAGVASTSTMTGSRRRSDS